MRPRRLTVTRGNGRVAAPIQDNNTLPRGIHVAPWRSETGRPVLLVVTGWGTLATPPYSVSDGEDVLVAYELMDGLLERADPEWTRPKPKLTT